MSTLGGEHPTKDSTPSVGACLARLVGADKYKEWSQQFRIACQYQGIWRLFTSHEEVLKPSDKSNDRKYALDHRRYTRYLQRKEYAMAFLSESIAPRMREAVRDCHDPKEAWATLESLYDVTLWPPLRAAEVTMHRLRQKHCVSLGQFIRCIKTLRDKINRLEGESTEDQCKLKIITSLEPQYTSRLMRGGLTLEDMNEMSLKDFMQRLLKIEVEIEEERMGARCAAKEDDRSDLLQSCKNLFSYPAERKERPPAISTPLRERRMTALYSPQKTVPSPFSHPPGDAYGSHAYHSQAASEAYHSQLPSDAYRTQATEDAYAEAGIPESMRTMKRLSIYNNDM